MKNFKFNGKLNGVYIEKYRKCYLKNNIFIGNFINHCNGYIWAKGYYKNGKLVEYKFYKK
jgi:hypothetical protein